MLRDPVPTTVLNDYRTENNPLPIYNYELFNCNNFNIYYWSWNYRGCWPFLPIGSKHFLMEPLIPNSPRS